LINIKQLMLPRITDPSSPPSMSTRSTSARSLFGDGRKYFSTPSTRADLDQTFGHSATMTLWLHSTDRRIPFWTRSSRGGAEALQGVLAVLIIGLEYERLTVISDRIILASKGFVYERPVI
jgi:hypothetical protein